MNAGSLRAGLFGCPLDTGNRGVSALGLSTIRGLLNQAPNAELIVFDYGKGTRRAKLDLGDRIADVRFLGCSYSRRFYRPANLAQLYLAARLGLHGIHPVLRLLRSLDVILDISGGDSFSDIYGAWRFRSVTLPKLLAIRLGIPLILLPQTYGPYHSPRAAETAAFVLARAAQVWARDEISLEVARGLIDPAHEGGRLRLGVDVAFGLPAREPQHTELREAIRSFKSRHPVVIGLNVSGLLYNRPGEDVSRYGLRSSYRGTIELLLERLLGLDGLGVLLVPHVAPSGGNPDCDATACATIQEKLPKSSVERVLPVSATLDAMELKWVIAQSDWFCGTRMHSCIAALSMGVPTTAIAYSDKTRGVFQSAGVGENVVDPRSLEGSEVVEEILRGFENRNRLAERLKGGLAQVRRRLDEQFGVILAGIG